MAKSLTDSLIASLRPQRNQSGWREIADGGCRGLCIRISPRAERVWVVRHMVGGKRRRHTPGAYPAISLAAARQRAGEYLAAAREGLSPEAVDAHTRALTLTVAQAHAEYLSVVGKQLRPGILALKKILFSAHIEPVIGQRPIRTIRRPDVGNVVSAVAAKGHAVQANRVYSETDGTVAIVRPEVLPGRSPIHPQTRPEEFRRGQGKTPHPYPDTYGDLARLGVDERTAEMVIGDVTPGIQRVYDLHERLEERRDALEQWAALVIMLGEQTVRSPRHDWSGGWRCPRARRSSS